MTILAGTANSTRLKLDFRAYFRNFIVEHGEPIRADGRLLFRDGWGYSATDHAGPEFPPPTDPEVLRQLQKQYWTRQYLKLNSERTPLANQIQALKDRDDRTSLPLQQRRSYETEEGGGLIRKLGEPEDLDLSGLESNLADLDYLMAEAQEELEALR